MFGIHNYTVFLVSSVLLHLTPGTDTVYIVSRCLAGGRRQGVASALGISTGILVHTLLVALGLSALIAGSPVAFSCMKWMGAGYLILMGTKTLFKKGNASSTTDQNGSMGLWSIYGQGVLTNALNPKVALFFLAFLPQFAEPGNSFGPIPFLLLGLSFFATSTLWSMVLAFGSGALNRWIVKNDRVQTVLTKLSGMVYIALGLNLLRAKLTA